jgi:hypothetical protein
MKTRVINYVSKNKRVILGSLFVPTAFATFVSAQVLKFSDTPPVWWILLSAGMVVSGVSMIISPIKKDKPEMKRMNKATPEEIFNDYRAYVGCHNYDGEEITEALLRAWAKDENRKLVCIFCGDEPVDTGGFIYCQNCESYKGIVPDVDSGIS